DTERAVEILTRYQSTLRSPEEQELKASIGKVSHIFQSELFQALLGKSLLVAAALWSAGSAGCWRCRGGDRGCPSPARGPPLRVLLQAAERGPPAGARPRLVRVTARRTEAPASICSLLLGAHGTLPQVSE
ncbi:DLG1 protein, partial [Casuarius casuarius]|nr:DLG1 protein [Casuarius casuarius]